MPPPWPSLPGRGIAGQSFDIFRSALRARFKHTTGQVQPAFEFDTPDLGNGSYIFPSSTSSLISIKPPLPPHLQGSFASWPRNARRKTKSGNNILRDCYNKTNANLFSYLWICWYAFDKRSQKRGSGSSQFRTSVLAMECFPILTQPIT